MEAPQGGAEADRGGRSPADVSALLIELGRGWKSEPEDHDEGKGARGGSDPRGAGVRNMEEVHLDLLAGAHPPRCDAAPVMRLDERTEAEPARGGTDPLQPDRAVLARIRP